MRLPPGSLIQRHILQRPAPAGNSVFSSRFLWCVGRWPDREVSQAVGDAPPLLQHAYFRFRMGNAFRNAQRSFAKLVPAEPPSQFADRRIEGTTAGVGMRKLFENIEESERQVLIVLSDLAIALLSAGLFLDLLGVLPSKPF